MTALAAAMLAGSAGTPVAVCCLRWRSPRFPFPVAVGVAVVVSLAVDVVYRGPGVLVSLGLIVELPALLAIVGLVVRRAPSRVAAVLTPLLGVAVVGLPARYPNSEDRLPWGAALFLASVAYLLLAGTVFGALGLRVRADRRLAELRAARRAQRLEVARDLHDFVAHEVTGIVLEAQAARMEAQAARAEVPLAGADAKAAGVDVRAVGADAQTLERIEDAGLRALASMDSMVHALRGSGPRPDADAAPESHTASRGHGLDELPGMVARFSTAGGVRASLDLPQVLADAVPAEVATEICHVVAEALTNVRRHAGSATEVRVAVSAVGGAAIEVSVTDDGTGDRVPGIGRGLRRAGWRGGSGLASLAERVGALGGRLTAGPHDNGWRVRVRLPLQPRRS